MKRNSVFIALVIAVTFIFFVLMNTMINVNKKPIKTSHRGSIGQLMNTLKSK